MFECIFTNKSIVKEMYVHKFRDDRSQAFLGLTNILTQALSKARNN